MKKVALSLFGIFLCVSVLNMTTANAEEAKEAPKTRTVTFVITGMVWGGACPPKVVAAIKTLSGIENVKIKYKKKTATVKVLVEGGPSDKEIIAALKKAKYGAKVQA